MYYWIFGVSLLAILALYVGVGMARGKRYLWTWSALRAASLCVAAVAAMVLSVLIARAVAAFAYPFLLDAPFMGQASELIRAMPSATVLFRALVSVLLAPVLFSGFFAGLRRVANHLARYGAKELLRKRREKQLSHPVAELAAESKKEEKKRARSMDELRAEGKNPKGMAFGGLCGLLLCVGMLTPILGLVSLTDAAVKMTALQAEEPPTGIVVQLTDAAANNVASKGLGLLGVKPLYSGLTAADAGEHRLRLVKEIEFVSAAGSAVMESMDPSVPREEAADRVRKTADAFSETTLLPTLLPELCVAAEESWSRGEPFCGVAKPSLGGAEGLIDSILALLTDSDFETVKTDMDTAMELSAILVERHGFSAMLSDPEGLLSDRETVSDLLYVMLRNPPTRPYVGTLSQYGMRVLGDALSVRYERESLYEEFLEDGADMIEGARVDGVLEHDLLEKGYIELLDEYGLMLTDRAFETLVVETSGRYERRSAGGADYARFLSEQPLTMKNGYMVTLEDSLRMKQASMLVGLSELTFDSERVELPEARREADTLAEALEAAMELCARFREGASISVTLGGMGPILDALGESRTVGAEETDRLLMCLLQSEEICDRVGFGVCDACELASKVNQKARTQGYTRVLSAMGYATEVIRGSVAGEKIEPDMEALMELLNRDVAEVLRTMASPGVLLANGAADTGAEKAAELFADLMEDLAEAKAKGVSGEEYRQELYAATDLINLALAPGDILFGEDGKLGITADEYVLRMFASEAVARTVVQTTYPGDTQVALRDPLKTGKKPTAAEEGALLEAMNRVWAQSTGEQRSDANYRKLYGAMGAMIGLELELNQAGVTKIPSAPEPGGANAETEISGNQA